MKDTVVLGFCLDIQHRLDLHEGFSAYTIFAPVPCVDRSNRMLGCYYGHGYLWTLLCFWKYLFVYTGGKMVE
jgi:hypothetical protein